MNWYAAEVYAGHRKDQPVLAKAKRSRLVSLNHPGRRKKVRKRDFGRHGKKKRLKTDRKGQ